MTLMDIKPKEPTKNAKIIKKNTTKSITTEERIKQ